MRVHGFYELLDDADEGGATWVSLVAGLAVLRVISSSLGNDTVSTALETLAAENVSAVPDLALRQLLEAMLEAAEPNVPLQERAHRLAGRVFSYAKVLQNAGQWNAAIDVAAFSAEIARTVRDQELAIQAHLQQAYGCRRLSRFADAAAIYREAITCATRHGLKRLAWQADLGLARVAIEEHRLADSTGILDRIIVEATVADDSVMLGTALLERGVVAGLSGDHAGVIRLGRDALRCEIDMRDRDVVLKNVATALRETGEAHSARLLAKILQARAIEVERRTMADILLMHLDADAGDMAAFAERSHRIGRQALTARVAVEYLDALARGLAVSGDFSRAFAAAERMRRMAIDSHLSAAAGRAELALHDLSEGRVPVVYQFRPAQLSADERSAVHVLTTDVHRLLTTV